MLNIGESRYYYRTFTISKTGTLDFPWIATSESFNITLNARTLHIMQDLINNIVLEQKGNSNECSK